MNQTTNPIGEADIPTPWLWRTLLALEAWARPDWGWGVLIACMALTMLPAVALRANRWIDLGDFQSILEVVGPLAVLAVWALWGWRGQRRKRFGWLALLASLLIGILVVSQLLLGWIPGPRAIAQALSTGDWAQLLLHPLTVWTRAASRFALWWDGVTAGGAAQDNLVFAAFAAFILWPLGLMTAWLARALRQGLAASLPALWLIGLILLYSSSGRYLLIVGIALMLALHILLEQGALMLRWQQMHLDYSPGLLLDRLITVLGAGAIILTIAAIMPNLYIGPLVDRYYALLAPANLALEQFGERLFPELHGTSQLRGGAGSGMPNEFLLRGGPIQGSAVVMRVRTDEAPSYQNYPMPYDEMAAPPGHYMRGRTLTVYNGHGWSNPSGLDIEEVAANQRWTNEESWGRKQVVQSVILEMGAATLFAAPEPVEASTSAKIEMRSGDDVVAVRNAEASYTVVSMVPAVNEEMLRALPAWRIQAVTDSGSGPLLPEPLAIHLALPDSITARTRDLAQQLTAAKTTSYDKALAIEQYLRQYTYDLAVPAPPEDITDVADYFLFELQRGYCDYYATAFVVLARLAGLPARFATGYAPGLWDPREGVFVITESEAHSWPEVYFPEAGWVPFEPTAGRAELTRVALPQISAAAMPPPIVPATPAERSGTQWNWQQVLWLVPIAGIIWLATLGVQWWRRRREDPWQAVLQWGQRLGRPMGDGETVLEYGEELAGYVMLRQSNTQDAGRIAAREIQALSEEVNRMRYGRAGERSHALAALQQHWERLRTYLPLVRIS